eukprot:3880863-Rhodomonas_salina.1
MGHCIVSCTVPVPASSVAGGYGAANTSVLTQGMVLPGPFAQRHSRRRRYYHSAGQYRPTRVLCA